MMIIMMMMAQSPGYSPVTEQHHNDASRPSLGFPLGTALLLIVIFSLSGVFSCCYHWDKFRSLRQSYSDEIDLEAANNPSKPKLINPMKQKQEEIQSVTVIMPGDQMPKFIAMPCPCEPPRLEAPTLVPTPNKPAKLPRFPVPLY